MQNKKSWMFIEIAVMNLRLHAAALAGQGKRCPPLGRHADHSLNVFLCCDGLAAGDPTNQRHLCHGGHWLKSRRDLRLIFERNRLIPVQHGYHIIEIHVDCLRHRFDRLKRWYDGLVVYRVYVSFQNGYICLAQPGHFGKLIHTVAMFSAVLFYQIAQNHVEPPSFLLMVSSTSYILLDKKSSLLSNSLDILCLVC